MAPGLQYRISLAAFLPNAPEDMFSALGKDDQKIYVDAWPAISGYPYRCQCVWCGSRIFAVRRLMLWGKIDSLGS